MQVFVSTFFDENDESGLAKEFVTGYKAWLNGNSQNLTNNGGNAVVAAVSALGYDAYMTAVAAIEKALADGTLTQAALDASVLRILQLKLAHGIVDMPESG